MNTFRKLALCSALSLVPVARVPAHHSFAAFDLQRQVTVKGVVTSYQFKNPHIYMTVRVMQADGTTATTEIKAAPPSVLIPMGYKRDSVRVGEVVSITGHPSRARGERFISGNELHKSDGSYVPLALLARGTDAAETAAGLAAQSAVDTNATTQKDCIPVGSPMMMLYPVARTIALQGNRITVSVDWLDTERVIYVDGRKPPPSTQTYPEGYSIGRWEGRTLLVETSNFRTHPLGLSQLLPSSTQKHLTERFELSADGMTLTYAGTLRDPVYLAKPFEWVSHWQYRPDLPHSNQKCDLKVARKFLGS